MLERFGPDALIFHNLHKRIWPSAQRDSCCLSHIRSLSQPPALLRRNLMTAGINLIALKERWIAIGEAVLEITGECHPCSLMEAVLGTGGYNALRGRGGLTARVVRDGAIRVGDMITRMERGAIGAA